MLNDPHYASTHKTALARFLMLVTVSLVALVFAFIVMHRNGGDRNIRRNAVISDLQNINTAFEKFNTDTGRYPTTAEGLDALLTFPADLTATWHGPYLDQIPLDKWGHDYIYRCPGTQNPTGFDLISVGPDGMEGNADDLTKDSR